MAAVVVTRADNLVRIPVVIVVGVVTAYTIVKLHLLGDALSHHFNPRRKPGHSKETEKENEHDSE